MRQSRLAIALASVACALPAFASPALASHAAPVRLAPSSKWQMDYAPDSCRLLRSFGEGRDQIVYVVDHYQPHDRGSVMLVGTRLRAEQLDVPVKVAYGPGGELAARNATGGTLGNRPMLLVGRIDLMNREKPNPEGTLPPLSPERLQAISELHVVNGPVDAVLELGPMDQPMAAMDKCLADLVTSWGLDPAVVAKWQQPPLPKGNPGLWLVSSDYPPGMLMVGASAIVQFRLMIDATGTPTLCRIQTETKPAGFADVTCKAIMRRARFSPALDDKGQPVPGYYVSSVRWHWGPTPREPRH